MKVYSNSIRSLWLYGSGSPRNGGGYRSGHGDLTGSVRGSGSGSGVDFGYNTGRGNGYYPVQLIKY